MCFEFPLLLVAPSAAGFLLRFKARRIAGRELFVGPMWEFPQEARRTPQNHRACAISLAHRGQIPEVPECRILRITRAS